MTGWELIVIIGVCIFGISGFLVYASYSISAGIYLKSLCRFEAASGCVALTFDDGVDPVLTPQVLDILKKHRMHATFFVIGEKAAAHPELVRRMVAEGHSVGNHTYHHAGRFPLMSRADMIQEIQRCDEVLASVGVSSRWFRPPFGVTNPPVAKAVRSTGMYSVGWSIRSLDTVGKPAEWVRHRINRRLKQGSIILLHDDRPDIVSLLEYILSDLSRKNLNSVSLDEMNAV